MADLPVGARVRIGSVDGQVVGHRHIVLVRIPGACEAGRFDPKFVHLVEPMSGSNGTQDADEESASETGDWAAGDLVEYDAYGCRFTARLIRPDGGRCWRAVVETFDGVHEPEGVFAIGDEVGVVYGHSTKIGSAPSVADSELRDRMAQYIHTAQCESSTEDDPWNCGVQSHWQEWRELADITMAAVAPVLAASRSDATTANLTVETARRRLVDLTDANESLTLGELLDRVGEMDDRYIALSKEASKRRRELEAEIERLESNEEFVDRALHLVLGCCDPATMHADDCQGRARLVYDAVRSGRVIPFHWPTVSRERDSLRADREARMDEVEAAFVALRKIADRTVWEYPPSLTDRIELVGSRLNEARAERDELRVHGVARDIGEANEQLRAELANAVVLPEHWREHLSGAIKQCRGVMHPLDSAVTAVHQVIESWLGVGDVKPPAVPLHSGTENESQPRWRTHPGTGVMHLLLPGTTRAICNAAESYAWRAAVDGNAKHTVCNELAGSASTAEEKRAGVELDPQTWNPRKDGS